MGSKNQRILKNINIVTFVIGDDWKGKFDYLKDEGVEVIYLPRTPEISTTQIKKIYIIQKKNKAIAIAIASFL